MRADLLDTRLWRAGDAVAEVAAVYGARPVNLRRRVDLRLWVRVTPDWYDRVDLLRERGYGDEPDEER